MSECLARLDRWIAKAGKPEGYAWFSDALIQIQQAPVANYSDLLPLLSARARRKLGTQKIDSESSDGHTVMVMPDSSQIKINISDWNVADTARIALLLQAQWLMPLEGSENLIEHCYRLGDEQERGAIMRGLMLFQQRKTLKPLALMAGRTNSLTFFSTIAHFNYYPSAYYSDDEFNQLVLKALFSDIGIAPIMGLKQRVNRKLSAMCEDYIDERLDAGRTIPADIWLAMLPYASQRTESMVLAALEDGDPERRYYASIALASVADERPEFKVLIDSHVTQESLSKIAPLLDSATKQ